MGEVDGLAGRSLGLVWRTWVRRVVEIWIACRGAV